MKKIRHGGTLMLDKRFWIGNFAMITTCIYTGLSMPVQIYEIIKKHSMESFSPFMLIMLFATFLSWVVYSLFANKKIDWFIFVPNLMGAIGSLILIILKVIL